MARKKAVEAVTEENIVETTEQEVPVFTREQLLASNRFGKRRDLVGALLKDGETYTIAEVEEKIQGFLKGKVK